MERATVRVQDGGNVTFSEFGKDSNGDVWRLMEILEGNAGSGNSEGGEGLLQGGDMIRPSREGGFDSGEGVEATDFLEFSRGRVNSTMGFGKFMNEPVNLEEDTGMRTSNFHFRGNLDIGLAVGGVAAWMSRDALGCLMVLDCLACMAVTVLETGET
jgi:hypothetical protein